MVSGNFSTLTLKRFSAKGYMFALRVSNVEAHADAKTALAGERTDKMSDARDG